jgi:lysozyme family protein
MADFSVALAKTESSEGGFYWNNTTQEITNRGITAATLSSLGLLPEDIATAYAQYRESKDSVWAKPVVEFIKGLSEDYTAAFYLKYFWNPIQGDSIASQEIGEKLFDVAVNQGLETAVREMQRAVNDALADGPTEQVINVDGVIGPHTLAAINSIDPIHLLIAFQTRVAERYRTIAAEDPELAGDLGSINPPSGWLGRLYS